jgi:hypothetical protein
MARTLLTPVNCTENSTAASNVVSSGNMVTLTTAGVYVKTTGIDPTKLIFFVHLNSSKNSSAGKVIIRAGSTAGKDDFEPGKYSTLRDHNVSITAQTTGDKTGVTKKFFIIPETARFLDSNKYINIDGSSKISSVRNLASTLGSKIGAIYVV